MTKQQRMEAALTAGLAPNQMSIADESHRHSRGTETHYNLIIVSDAFDGLMRLKRHRAVHDALGPLMGEIHSLTMKTLTPAEWDAAGGEVSNPAPACEGGSK